MTGAYLRVRRDNKWQSIEVEHLTDDERETILAEDNRLMKWLHIVCNKLAEIEPLLEELEQDGIIGREGE
jgi:hypothetical protein